MTLHNTSIEAQTRVPRQFRISDRCRARLHYGRVTEQAFSAFRYHADEARFANRSDMNRQRSPPGKRWLSILAAEAAARSESRSPIRKLDSASTGQHRRRSKIIPGPGFRQWLTRRYDGMTA